MPVKIQMSFTFPSKLFPSPPSFQLLLMLASVSQRSLLLHDSFPFIYYIVLEFSRQSAKCIVVFFLKIKITHALLALNLNLISGSPGSVKDYLVAFQLLIFCVCWGEFILASNYWISKSQSLHPFPSYQGLFILSSLKIILPFLRIF